jgi:xanthine/CO dehydrogenase XdhC/CoxF family maturation factor
MTDLDQILALWRDFQKGGTEYVLASVVRVDGSGYRKPGARMLVGSDGRRAGTVSGGCLEGEVARKAFWHTQHGPVVRRYSTTTEDGEVPFGMGCGGIVYLLLERSGTANPLMERLAAEFAERRPLAVATMLSGREIGRRAYFPAPTSGEPEDAQVDEPLVELALAGFEEQRSFETAISVEGDLLDVCVEWCAARPGLFIFGAGDDVIPLVKMTKQLGWYVEVADGRSNLATRMRFPEADAVRVIDAQWSGSEMPIRDRDAAVLMTHSMEQDAGILNALLVSGIVSEPSHGLGYLGVLGPRHRVEDVLRIVTQDRDIAEPLVEQTVAKWFAQIHAPIGLDLGGDTPADIALSVIAEVQQTHYGTSGRPLREVRRGVMAATPAAVAK